MTPQPPGSYSGDPSSSPKDECRFLTGDTGWNGAPWQLADAEIQYQLTIVNPPPATIPASGNYLAAANCAATIAARYKGFVDKSVGDLKLSYSQLSKQFEAIALRLRSQAAINAVPFYVGGLSLSTKAANARNRDLVQPAVVKDGQDNGLPVPQVPGANGGNQV